MTAALVTIAEQVKTDLALGPTLDAAGNVASISGEPARIGQALSVSRKYLPRFDAPEQAAGAYVVIVLPAGEQTTRAARGMLSVEYAIEIGVCAQLADLENATVDAAMQVLQEIADYFFNYGLTGSPATWIRNDVIEWPSQEQLENGVVLFAMWTAIFQGQRGQQS